jgi:sucrose-phosphate synthase
MLRGEPRAVVVANHAGELRHLRGRKGIYFTKKPCAAGILEGLRHYRFSDRVERNSR